MAVKKTKWYLYETMPDNMRPHEFRGLGLRLKVRSDLGEWDTETRAYRSMMSWEPMEDGNLLAQRKPEFEGMSTVLGKRVLENPRLWDAEGTQEDEDDVIRNPCPKCGAELQLEYVQVRSATHLEPAEYAERVFCWECGFEERNE